MGDSDSDSDAYGPKLPSIAAKKSYKDGSEEEEEEDSYMPALPPHLRKTDGGAASTAQDSEEANKSESEDEGEEYCPALPPHMMQGGSKGPASPNNKRRPLVGPVLPRNFAPPTVDPPSERDAEEEEEKEEEDSEEEEEEEGPMIGPLPPVDKVNPKEYRAWEMEERARKMRDKLEGRNFESNKPLVRETWMTELPEDKPNFCGLGPRQFLRKTPTERGDRSCWTDTPADRAKKAQQEQEQQQQQDGTPEEEAVQQRDKELTEKVNEYNKKKRAKPLVDLHKKELKKKKISEGPKERRPFSREEDLCVNKFDDAQRETIMKKARQLNDRFSAGKAKFL